MSKVYLDNIQCDDVVEHVEELLTEIVDNAMRIVDVPTVTFRTKGGPNKYSRMNKVQTAMVNYDSNHLNVVECRNNYLNLHKRCVSESVIGDCVIDENDNQDYTIQSIHKEAVKPKEKPKKKKISFNSIFNRKDKTKSKVTAKEEEETHDNLPQLPIFRSNNLVSSKKYASALELRQKPQTLQRSNSLIRKLVNIGTDSIFVKKSLSFHESKKPDKEPTREQISKQKLQEWRQSLQSLVENDTSVSYDDLSYVDYDVLNSIKYETASLKPNNFKNDHLGRTQSMIERSPGTRRAVYQRHNSVSSRHASKTVLNSAALSLPSLSFGLSKSGSTSSLQNTRYRTSSVYSDEGQRTSFLVPSDNHENKRHSAHIQRENLEGRSRSLSNLDAFEGRQGVISSPDVPLKDSKSEPDCTKPVVASVVEKEPTQPVNVAPHTRRHMLSRSQKSSSECFSVNFEVGDESTWENELFFPAQRGLTLHESLAKQCELRNIDLSLCDVRLQDRESNAEIFIPLSHDTAHLVGRHVRITAKEAYNRTSGSFYGTHSRKPSGSYRPHTYFSSSTEDPYLGGSTLSLQNCDQNKKQIKQRLTAFFGNIKDTKYEALIEQLDKYSKQGIPHVLKYPQGQAESIDALYKLEDDWRDIIEHADLTERQQQQQTALWELIKTEVAYIKTLKVVTDLFLACLKDLQSKQLLKEIDTEKLFSNINKILDANVLFWRNTLFPLVKHMRKYKRPPSLETMLEGFQECFQEGFQGTQETFQPYYKYCADQSRCQHYCRENLESDVFTAYLTWCESQKECNRLRLMDILVQPMQRLTKYGLLLKAILKNTDEEVEKENLQSMIKMVDEFVNNVNSSLKHRQDKERLKGIIARIESYDIVETKDDDIEKIMKNHKSLTQLDLTRPMLNCPPERKRHLLLEGDLKFKDTITSTKIEVHCFLLTDMLLVCKPSTKKGGATVRVVRQPYLVDRLVVSDLQKETPSLAVVYKNELDMAITAFILQNNDARKIKGWKDGILKAQTLYAQAKHMNYSADESSEMDYTIDNNLETDYSNLQVAPRSPAASSSRASRISSLAHSHSSSVDMNDQSSVGSINNPSRGVSMETENRNESISSDEGVQPLPPDKSPLVSQKNSFKNRLLHKTPNTLSVQSYDSLGQSLPNLTIGSPGMSTLSLNFNQNTLSVPGSRNGGQLLSPPHRGISYPPPSPTRGNLRRSLAISQNKNPPLIKTRQVNSASSVSQQTPASLDFDVPIIAGFSFPNENESASRGQQGQPIRRANQQHHTPSTGDDLKKTITEDIPQKCSSCNCEPSTENRT